MRVGERLQTVWGAFTRTKKLPKDDIMQTPLRRCLTTLDLTLVGFGNMSGVGIYILTGTVVRNRAGPAAFLSFALAGIAALLNAACYAELSCRIPKAGSAYTFTYVTTGEFPAFLIGWCVVLEYLLGTASVSKGLAAAVDVLSDGAVSNGTEALTGPLPTGIGLSDFPDLLSGAFILALGFILLTGPKASARLNAFMTLPNLAVLSFIAVAMFVGAKPSTFAPADHGGFFPFKVGGVITGAASLFFSYIGFDAITMSVEEAEDPFKSMPRALFLSVGLVASLKIICSAALVLYVPWWTVVRSSAFISAFEDYGWLWAKWIAGTGYLLGIGACLFMSMHAAPRILFAMGRDGLLFRWLSIVLPCSQVPVFAIIIFTPLAATLAILLDIQTIADSLSVGTLVAYSFVSASIVLTRYRRPDFLAEPEKEKEESKPLPGTLLPSFAGLRGLRNLQPGTGATLGITIFAVASFSLCCVTLLGGSGSIPFWLMIIFAAFLIIVMLASVVVISAHVQDKDFDTWKVPWVPVIPCAAILLNMFLASSLPAVTWIRFLGWIALGLAIYFIYGVWHSSEREMPNEKLPLVSSEVPKSSDSDKD